MLGWGGHVNVLSSAHMRCCYAAEISGILATYMLHHVATLQRSLVSLLRYMLLRCRDLWYPCYVTCCYAAEISGILATLHVATLQRSPLVSLLRYMLLRCRDLWYSCYVTCCYAAEISGILATLHVATLQRSLVSLLRFMVLRCRDLWYPCYVTCCYAAEISGILATLHVASCCDAAEISGILATLHVATLQRSPLVSLLRYMLLRCRDLWYPCYVTCCIMLRRCRDLWYPCYVTCCYSAEISSILATLHVATLQRSPLVSLLRYMLLRCRDLWYSCYVTCCYAAEISGILATLHVATLRICEGCPARPLHHQMPYRHDWCCVDQVRTIHPQLFGCQAQRCHVICQNVAMEIHQQVQEAAWEDCRDAAKDRHKHPNLDVQICHFSSDTNGCLAVAKHTFCCKTLFSWAGFRSGRDVYHPSQIIHVFLDVPPRLLLNMLIGVMCEVVSGVSQTERESMAETFVREKVRMGIMCMG